jgi:ATP synthase protein I
MRLLLYFVAVLGRKEAGYATYMPPPDPARAPQVILLQTLTTIATGAAASLFDHALALSTVVGAGTGTLANAFFAFWIFRRYWAQAPGALVLRFYWAELAKITIALASFTAAYLSIDELRPTALLGAYLFVQVFPPMLACRGNAGRTREGC